MVEKATEVVLAAATAPAAGVCAAAPGAIPAAAVPGQCLLLRVAGQMGKMDRYPPLKQLQGPAPTAARTTGREALQESCACHQRMVMLAVSLRFCPGTTRPVYISSGTGAVMTACGPHPWTSLVAQCTIRQACSIPRFASSCQATAAAPVIPLVRPKAQRQELGQRLFLSCPGEVWGLLVSAAKNWMRCLHLVLLRLAKTLARAPSRHLAMRATLQQAQTHHHQQLQEQQRQQQVGP